MCGIAAVLNPRGQARPLDTGLIAHRGPDACGSHSLATGHVWLGHTRLAILDLSAHGKQPMADSITGNWIVFNGEIYNHQTLRRELPARDWHSSSDTETLLAAYAAWGPAMLRRLRGMYAFVIYDASDASLFAARDPLGIKPLYYSQEDGEIRFCSEVRPLLTAHNRRISPQSLAGYLRFGAFAESALPHPSLHTLPAGHHLRADAHITGSLIPHWPAEDFSAPPPSPSLPALRQLVEDAVEEHLLADVPVGAFLSGGIDSTLVASLAARHLGSALQAFTVSLPGFAGDELAIARETARSIGCQHHIITVDEARALQGITEGVASMDLPSLDAVNTYLVSSAVASQGIKVALSGLGGDELFGGYPGFRDVPRLQRLALIPRPLLHLLGTVKPLFRRLADMPAAADTPSLAAWRRYFATNRELRPILGDIPAPELPAPPPGLDAYAQISWAELNGYTRHLLLRDTDQMTMAHSLEARVPLLDIRLVEHALRLPGAWKESFPHTKGALVAAFEDTLPRACYNRPKQGFELPMDTWIRGPLHAFAREGLAHLRERAPQISPLIHDRETRFAAKALHWTRLWLLVVLGHYLQKHDLHF